MKLRAQRLDVVPVADALPQEYELRQRSAVLRIEPHGVRVRLHRAGDVAFALEQPRELELQRRRVGLACERGIERRARLPAHAGRGFELRLEAGVRRKRYAATANSMNRALGKTQFMMEELPILVSEAAA